MKQSEELATATVDITIAADGRVFVFGLSREVLHVLAELSPRDERLQRRLRRLREIDRDRMTLPGEK